MTCQWSLNSGFQSLAGFRIPNTEFRIQRAGKTCDLFCCKTSWMERLHSRAWPTSMQIYWNKRKRLHKKKEFNVHRIGLEHQYGRRDVMWKHSIAMLRVLPPTNQICLATNQFVAGCGKLLPKVESCSTFCKKICTTCARFTGPRQTCFAASDVTSTYSATPA